MITTDVFGHCHSTSRVAKLVRLNVVYDTVYVAVADDLVSTLSNLAYTIHFHPGYDRRAIARELAAWRQRFADPLRASIRPHSNDSNPDRKLRIGYVSPDFCDQAECFFVIPLLEAHDRAAFEVHCYSSVRVPDAITDRFRRIADQWHDVRWLSDETLAQQIRGDGIDILIDLTMHMKGGRLPMFARKPAPVQVAWLAYPGSTGVDAIDYRLTDRYMEPEGEDDSWSAEKPLTPGRERICRSS